MTPTSSTSARRLPGTPLARLLTAAAAVAVVLQLLTRWTVEADGPVVDLTGALPWASGPALLAVLLVLTVLGDQLSVPLRHGEQLEHLTFFEAAVLLDVTLLPAGRALTLALVVVVFRDVARRRPVVKAVFNVSLLATASASLVLVVHLLTGPGAGLGARTVVALVAGTAAFAAVNLLILSCLLAVVADAHPWRVVRDEARLSAVMALGNVALGGTVLAVSTAAPAMLPFTVMPAAALLFAYRAAAQEAEERERSTGLLELSQLLAGRREADDLLGASLELVRQVFGADVAVAVLDQGDPAGARQTVLDDRLTGPASRPSTPAEERLLEHAARSGAGTLGADLPEGWSRALVAPLEADGRRLGAVVLGARDRTRPLGARELTLLTPTASALAAALRGAAHLRRVEEETGKLQAVVDSSSDGILVLDGAGTVQLWSPAVEALTGRASERALGRPLRELVVTRGADGLPCDPFLVGRGELSAQAPQATVEVTVVRDDGEQRVVRCAFAGVFTGGPDGADPELTRAVVIVHDVTRERQVERLKADFIATVSHELRTPVTPIKGYADLLRRRGDRMTPEKRREVLDVIVDRADHLSRLVEDLLLASRISAKEGESAAQVDMGRDDLASLTRRACADFGADGGRVTTVLPDGPVPVGCDPVRVIQVLTNLVGNALKYSAAGTPVQVALVVANGLARVEVADHGRGIPADQVERVFEKFHRVEDPMQMTTGGTGLGLYIARQLATAMGGTLDCTSTLGSGSVFRFALPLAGPAAEPAPEPPGRASPAPAPRRTFSRPEGLLGPDGRPAAQGRRTPPWAVPPPRPASASEQAGPQRLG